jgi:predicted lipid carrier protein YhbT
MATEVKCPSCGTAFPLEEVMAEEIKKDLRKQMQEYKAGKDLEFSKKEQEYAAKEQQQQLAFEQRLQNEKKELQLTMEQNLRKSISSDYENQFLMLQKGKEDADEKLKASRQKELEFLTERRSPETKRRRNAA